MGGERKRGTFSSSLLLVSLVPCQKEAREDPEHYTSDEYSYCVVVLWSELVYEKEKCGEEKEEAEDGEEDAEPNARAVARTLEGCKE